LALGLGCVDGGSDKGDDTAGEGIDGPADGATDGGAGDGGAGDGGAGDGGAGDGGAGDGGAGDGGAGDGGAGDGGAGDGGGTGTMPDTDDDGDGFTETDGDCDDTNPDAFPGAPEACGGTVDLDCDGRARGCPLVGDSGLADRRGAVGGDGAHDRLGQGEPGALAAGDLDGDGLDDLLVVALFGGASGEGQVGRLVGPLETDDTLSGRADAVALGRAADEDFGRGLAVLGDVDGDGVSDVFVAAPLADDAGRNAGAVWMLSADRLGDPLGLPTLLGAAAGDELGEMANIGDVNGDGRADLVVGAQFAGDDEGAAYLFAGPITALNDATLVVDGGPGDELGSALGGGADLDGDGLSDVALGARGWGGDARGAVAIFSGLASGRETLDEAHALLTGRAAGDELGWGISIAMGSDLNGDGYADLAVGARGDDTEGRDAGAAFVFFGPLPAGQVDLDAADATLVGEAGGDFTGDSLTLPGDLNQDGAEDLVVGSGYARTPGSDELWGGGAAYVVHGPVAPGAGRLALADAVLRAPHPEGRLRVHRGGDTDGDGWPELLISLQLYSSIYDEGGAVYRFEGE
jgi:hypothetical protein